MIGSLSDPYLIVIGSLSDPYPQVRSAAMMQAASAGYKNVEEEEGEVDVADAQVLLRVWQLPLLQSNALQEDNVYIVDAAHTVSVLLLCCTVVLYCCVVLLCCTVVLYCCVVLLCCTVV